MPFNPVIVRVGTTDQPLGQEIPIVDSAWWPAQPVSLSSLEMLSGIQQRLVVLPGQYRGRDAREHLYRQVDASLFASGSNDWTAPTISNVTQLNSLNTLTVTVNAADTSGLCRIVVAYTDGLGQWQHTDLTTTDGTMWRGVIAHPGQVEYFVQAVDAAGNVALDENGGDTTTRTSRVFTCP